MTFTRYALLMISSTLAIGALGLMVSCNRTNFTSIALEDVSTSKSADASSDLNLNFSPHREQATEQTPDVDTPAAALEQQVSVERPTLTISESVIEPTQDIKQDSIREPLAQETVQAPQQPLNPKPMSREEKIKDLETQAQEELKRMTPEERAAFDEYMRSMQEQITTSIEAFDKMSPEDQETYLAEIQTQHKANMDKLEKENPAAYHAIKVMEDLDYE